jgi:hypothetical protein
VELLKLTRFLTNEPVWINPVLIHYMDTSNVHSEWTGDRVQLTWGVPHTEIYLNNNKEPIKVQENPEDIYRLIKDEHT